MVLFPTAGIWWMAATVVWWRRPPPTERGLRRRVGAALAAAWMSLTVLLPAVYAWVWVDRVEWLVF